MDPIRPPSAPPLGRRPPLSTSHLSHHPSQPSLQLQPPVDRCSNLYIREKPQRSIAIASATHALILRHSPASTSRCMVELAPLSTQPLRDFRPLAPRPVFGTLGLMPSEGDVFLCVVTDAVRAATLRPGEAVERIDSVAFYCLTSAGYDEFSSSLDPSTSAFSSALDADAELVVAYGSNALGRREVSLEQHPCHALRKLLSNGSFYYSADFDVTRRLQDRPADSAAFDADNMDEAYLWNSFMIKPLVQFRSHLQAHEKEALDGSKILTSTFRGFCKSVAIPQTSAPLRVVRSGLPSFLTVMSRLSCLRAGTRFMSRGIDDDGNVANFVETETTYWTPSGTLFSYAQIRGSVPVFWEQAADLIPGRQRITVTRSAEGTQPAFNRHFQRLTNRYGSVHAINLLSEAKPGEAELTQLYHHGIQLCPLARPSDRDSALLRETHYDFHAETRGPTGYEAATLIRRWIETSTDSFAYYLAEDLVDDDNLDHGGDSHGRGRGDETHPRGSSLSSKTRARSGSRVSYARTVVVLQQEGIFRTNCLDCLDRTNLIQTLISRMAVEAFLDHRNEGGSAGADFWARHATLWADNGDALSKIYAGTGALKSSFTRHGKMSLSGAVADARKSVQRLYHNNFVDPSRQITIDMLLGRLVGQQPVQLFDPISDFVSAELARRSGEFTSTKDLKIFVGTFNLNGLIEGIGQDLSSWLWPEPESSPPPDIFAIGFQEMVELNAQHIVKTDPARRQQWEQAVRYALNSHRADARYVLLRSGQLVGAALCVFVAAAALRDVKNVEGNVKKTGLSGMAGNKGAVAIRFDYARTHICFVTAHLAAGFANYDERNRDYATIHNGLRFQRNRAIADHDTVIWLGDFNYRIGLGPEHTRALIKKGDLETLYDNDQLNLQMMAGLAFQYYSESRITFMPTYKFDKWTDDYDTSDKARIPAWTDRILRKGSNLRQLSYCSAPLKFSDHRPVYATFQCSVVVVDEAQWAAIGAELYQRRKEQTANGADSDVDADDDDDDDDDGVGGLAVMPGLPLASSDRHKWWLDNGRTARADITPPPLQSPRDGFISVLNPARPSNPFGPTEESDWIAVPAPPSPPPRQAVSPRSTSSSPFEIILSSSTSGPHRQAAFARAGRAAKDHPAAAAAPLPPPPGFGKISVGPTLPPQVSGVARARAAAAAAAASEDLLGAIDGDAHDLGGWEALEPRKSVAS